ncbi:hypothetical protein Terro_1230 [Terriglobus roseus DSM 18391]|uniref:Uncharacterized protein n=1 Tax=Terriglobus roseus (strain DSM 18391 / NRRL B-41598 / KBS 63) TaxID=926566 RepID=I3ZE72_TERRK|nr:hypothetical protein Terro_1230 [Terriglobus roseus DSM 18391]
MQTRQQLRACLRRRTRLQVFVMALFLGLPVLIISFFICVEIWNYLEMNSHLIWHRTMNRPLREENQDAVWSRHKTPEEEGLP